MKKAFNWRVAETLENMRRKVKFPTIERLRVRRALGELRLRSWENLSYYNPLKDANGGFQWLEFVVDYNHKPFVILFKAGHRRGGPKPYEKRNIELKKRFLQAKGIPFVVLKRTHTTQEYQFFIRRAIKERGVEGAEQLHHLLHPEQPHERET